MLMLAPPRLASISKPADLRRPPGRRPGKARFAYPEAMARPGPDRIVMSADPVSAPGDTGNSWLISHASPAPASRSGPGTGRFMTSAEARPP